MLISVIVSTYNRPDALRSVLAGFAEQSDRDFEVLVADDGSGDATRATVDALRPAFGVPVRHVWHEDRGFRLAAIRNLAATQAQGDYVLFVDGEPFWGLDRFDQIDRWLATGGF